MDDDEASARVPAPGWAVPGVGRPSPLLEALTQIRSGLESARAAATVLSDVDCRDGVREFDQVLSEVESFWLELVADLDGRPGAVPGVRAGSAAVAFLAAGLNRSYSQAKKDVAAARALTAPTGMAAATAGLATDGLTAIEAGDVPVAAPVAAPLALVGEAFAAGEITRGHIDVAVRCLEGIPRRILDAADGQGVAGSARVDAYLALHSRTFDPARLARLAKELQAVLNSEQEDSFDPDAYLRRQLRLHDSPDGMTLGKLQLDPASAVWVRAALAHFSASGRANGSAEEQNELPIRDGRTKGQRLVDALVEICRLAMDADPSRTRREPPHIMVVTTPEQLAEAHARRARATSKGTGSSTAPGLAEAMHVGPLSPATLARLSCDTILQAVVLDSRTGAVLHLGRTQRTASLAQRKALAVRDRGCIIPGCHAPPGRCDAHHVPPWSAGGQTDIDALALVCEAHHKQIHLGIWKIVLVEGVPHVEPPPWHRLSGAGPVRNRLHDAVQRARKLAQQLRLDLSPDLEQPGEAA